MYMGKELTVENQGEDLANMTLATLCDMLALPDDARSDDDLVRAVGTMIRELELARNRVVELRTQLAYVQGMYDQAARTIRRNRDYGETRDFVGID